jgi:hypothetical protein
MSADIKVENYSCETYGGKVALCQGYLRVWFFSVTVIVSLLHSHSCGYGLWAHYRSKFDTNMAPAHRNNRKIQRQVPVVVNTVNVYRVVLHKAFHTLRPLVYCSIVRPHLSSNHSWFSHQSCLTVTSRDIWYQSRRNLARNVSEFCLRVSVSYYRDL